MLKFISYNGSYPSYCYGTLVIEFAGLEYSLEGVLVSGGWVSFDDNWNENVTEGRWNIKTNALPIELQPWVDELEQLVNNHVPLGCCGGCV